MRPIPTKMRWLTMLLLIVALPLSGCHRHVKPDLKRLYMQGNDVNLPPVVLIHGILGGKLREKDSGEERWYGSVTKLLFSDFQDLELAIDPLTLEPIADGLEAYTITDRIAGTDYYAKIQRTLTEAGGYTYATPGTRKAAGDRRYYVYVYDWRQDNVRSAAGLDEFIEKIRLDYGNPDLKVDLIAHSMGGLITRYFLRYGTTDVLNDNAFPVNLGGAGKVRRVALLGTPNLGSVGSLHAFLEGYKLGFGRLPTESLATFPSVYQLFPHAINDWLIGINGQSIRRDLFDIELWRRLQWSVFDPKVRQRIGSRFDDPTDAAAYLETLERYFEKQLERARRFVWSLTIELPATPVRLLVFGGDCELTPARLLLEDLNEDTIVRLRPDDIANPMPAINYNHLMLEPGDGTVTKASLLAREALDPSVPRHRYSFFPLKQPFFVCETHDQLTGNVVFQNNLLHALISQDGSQ